jgi:hypothetical protein
MRSRYVNGKLTGLLLVPVLGGLALTAPVVVRAEDELMKTISSLTAPGNIKVAETCWTLITSKNSFCYAPNLDPGSGSGKMSSSSRSGRVTAAMYRVSATSGTLRQRRNIMPVLTLNVDIYVKLITVSLKIGRLLTSLQEPKESPWRASVVLARRLVGGDTTVPESPSSS